VEARPGGRTVSATMYVRQLPGSKPPSRTAHLPTADGTRSLCSAKLPVRRIMASVEPFYVQPCALCAAKDPKQALTAAAQYGTRR
jgi:hypothetical protein